MNGRHGSTARRTASRLALHLLLAVLLCLCFSPLAQADDSIYAITTSAVPDPIWTVTASASEATAGTTVQVTVADTADASWATGLVVTGQSGATFDFTTVTAATGNANGVNGTGVYSFVMPSEPVTVDFTWDATPLKVYVKVGSGEKTLVHSYTRAEMEALAAENADPIYYACWNRQPETFMGKAVRYVTIPQLVASAHSYDSAVRFDGPDCVMKGLSLDGWATNQSWSSLLGVPRYYHAALGDLYLDPANQTGVDREVPPILVITGWSGEQTYVDNQPYDTLNTYRFWYGQSAAEYATGAVPTLDERDARCTANNMAKKVTELTFEIPRTCTISADPVLTGGTLGIEPASAISGTTITVTPQPNEGWQLVEGSLAYTTDGGATHTPITETGGIHSFILPEADVVVTARFGNLSVPVSGVSLDQTSAELAVGDTLQLTATIAPSDAGNQEVTWTSGNEGVATVDGSGLVRAGGIGETTITVTTQDGNLTASCLVTVESGGQEYFTLAVIPDTQFYSELYPAIFTAQTQWIADNKEAQNIVFATHLGDIIDDYESGAEWENAQTAMNIIRDAGIPYSLVPGNHDVNMDAADPTRFDTYFSPACFSSFSWYGGHYPEGSNSSSYQLFSAMGHDFVVLDLVCNPTLLTAETIDWANGVLNTYADRKAIVVTHGYIKADGTLAGGDWVAGPTIRNNIVTNHQNVIAVVCGHIEGEYHGTDTGNAGNTIYNLLTDYTGESNGGDGWLRLYRFYPLQNKVEAVTYSPYLDAYQTDADSQFELALEQDSHLITFMSEGQPYQAIVAAGSSKIDAPTDPVKPGYIFGGWYADEALTTRVTFPYTVTGDVTLYAKLTCGYTYEVSGGAATLTAYAGPGGDVVIPETIDGYAVTATYDVVWGAPIEVGVFQDRTDITSITLPDSLTSIGGRTCYGCTHLASVTFGSGLVTIGENAFCWAKALDTVSLPSGVMSIGGDAFYGTALTTVTFPASVSTIGAWAFSDRVRPVYLERAYFLGSPPALGNSSLGSATVYYNITQAASWPGFSSYPKIPFSVLTLATNYEGGATTTVFSTLDAGGHLTYPTYVPTHLGYVFTGWHADSVCTNAWDFAQDTVSGDQTLYAGWSVGEPAGYLTITSVAAHPTYSGATSIALASATGPGNSLVYKVTDHPVAGVTTATTVTDGISYAGSATPVFVSAAQYVTVYEITSANTVVNYVCLQVASGEIKPGVNVDGFNYLLRGTTAALNGYTGPGGAVAIPSEITVGGATYAVVGLADYTFSGQTSLTSVTVPSGVTSLGNYAFSGCSNLISITLPDGLTSVGNYAFQDCAGLAAVGIPVSVIQIGEGAFAGCTHLASVNIPTGVTTLGYTFYHCASLASITIPASVTNLGFGVFTGCSGLSVVIIPSGVTSIEPEAFSYCSGLTTIVIPAGVQNIYFRAFQGCTQLVSAYFLGPQPGKMDSTTFAQTASGFTLYYPISEAASWSGFALYPAEPFCILTLDLEDGNTPHTSYAMVNAGGHIVAPADPTREGYTFGGWYKDAACTTAFSFTNEVVTGDITLHAKWNADNASVTLQTGWNLVAGGPGTIFPVALFGWNGSAFSSTSSPVAWQGYWCKVGAEELVDMSTVSGPHTSDLTTGWNLIGNPMGSTATLGLPSGRMAFDYDAVLHRYVSTTTLAPGQGAWVKGTVGETVTFTAE